MKRITIYFILIFVFLSGIIKSQQVENDSSPVLEALFDRLAGNYNDSDRLRINDSIRMIIDNYVESESIFEHRFSNLKYLGQITSPDSLIKIITWNLVLTRSPGIYFCYIIRKAENTSRNIIYRMSVVYSDASVRTDTLYTQDNWYGALYYDLRPVIADNSKDWILLGIDYGNPFISRKIIEVLSFSDNGTITFGKKWFLAGEDLRYRAVFEYASNGMMSLRFSSNNSIVFDHLVPFSPSHLGDRQFYGPDYSYDAYNFVDGAWRLSINVDARNKE